MQAKLKPWQHVSVRPSILGFRFILNGVPHRVIADDGRTVLIGKCGKVGWLGKFWISRDKVFPPAPQTPNYMFWLGAEGAPVTAGRAL